MVRKVIDLECLLPADESGKPRQYHEQASHRIGYGDPELLEPRPGYGFANYKNIFRKRVDGALGEGAAKAAAKPKGQSIKQFVEVFLVLERARQQKVGSGLFESQLDRFCL